MDEYNQFKALLSRTKIADNSQEVTILDIIKT